MEPEFDAWDDVVVFDDWGFDYLEDEGYGSDDGEGFGAWGGDEGGHPEASYGHEQDWYEAITQELMCELPFAGAAWLYFTADVLLWW